MVNSRPTIILSAAISVDGKIATKNGDSKMSSRRDLERLHKLRSKVDAVLIGAGTQRRDDPRLTVRYAKGDNPIRIVLDSRAAISPRSKIIKTANKVHTILVVSKDAPESKLDKLAKHSVDIIVCGEHQIDIRRLLNILYSMGIESVLVEGGGTTHWEFVQKDLFDRLIVTVSPRLIGGFDAVSLVNGSGFASISKSAKLYLDKTLRLGDEIVLYYARA